MAAKKKPTKSRTKPRIEIDLAEVERLAGLGLTQEEIALSLGIAIRTLYSRQGENADFAGAIKKGKAQANESVSNVLFELCKAGNVTAIIWYEKTRRGLDPSAYPLVTASNEMLCSGVPRPPFPKNLREFQRQFATEEACQDYLAASRWPEGFACRRCGHATLTRQFPRRLLGASADGP